MEAIASTGANGLSLIVPPPRNVPENFPSIVKGTDAETSYVGDEVARVKPYGNKFFEISSSWSFCHDPSLPGCFSGEKNLEIPRCQN